MASNKEKKIIELGQTLSRSLVTLAESLVNCQGLDSTLIASAETLVQRLKENNEKHNKLVDSIDLTGMHHGGGYISKK